MTDAPAFDAPAFDALAAARSLAAPGLRRVLPWQSARALLRLGALAAMAVVVGRLVMDGDAGAWMLAAVPALLLAAAAASLAAERAQARAEVDVSAGLRVKAGAALNGMDLRALRSLPSGTLALAMQRHPPAIAALVVGHRVARMMMAVGPLATVAALLAVSWQAAGLLVLLTPVMVVFFALVGEAIRARAQVQERAMGRLAGQFADRVRTLPTILANHALPAERSKLQARLDAYAANTMAVLRIAFVNAAVIDFFASMSIAMLAVFLGLGHLGLAMIPGFSDLALWQSLLILMIAPDYFAPFRRFSELYHAKAEGLAAATALDGLLNARVPAAPCLPAVDLALAGLALPERGLVAVTGPSGSGKSTLLRRIAGLEPGSELLAGRPLAWVSTDAPVPAGTLGEAIAPDDGASRADLKAATERVGLTLPGGLDAGIAPGGANLSGGQRMRVVLARALLSDRTVIADEPTAKLDPQTAAQVRLLLSEMARDRLVVVATHDPALAAMADLALDLAPTRLRDAA